MADNLIHFLKHAPDKQAGVDLDVAKRFFIEEVLPYVNKRSLERLIQANHTANLDAIQLEMMRMFIESEIMRSDQSDVVSGLRSYFAESNMAKASSRMSGR